MSVYSRYPALSIAVRCFIRQSASAIVQFEMINCLAYIELLTYLALYVRHREILQPNGPENAKKIIRLKKLLKSTKTA